MCVVVNVGLVLLFVTVRHPVAMLLESVGRQDRTSDEECWPEQSTVEVGRA
jgi:hypothetical protein